jgi:Sensors of blue-light using FAD
MYHQLVYNSAATSADLDRKDLESILIGARKRNELLGITGFLVYHRGEFLQLLEGDYDAVQHVYHDIILHDERHSAVGIAWQDTVAQRSFADWSMGFADIGGTAWPVTSAHPGYLGSSFDKLDLSGPASVGCSLLMSMYHHVCRMPIASQY